MNDPQVFVGDGITHYRNLVIAHGLEMYSKYRMIPNSGYTPKRMLEVAGEITGKKYGRREYLQAARDIRLLLPD